MSSSGKTQSGTLHSLGGTNFDDYYANLAALYQGEPETIDDVIEEFKNVLRPSAAGSQPQQQSQQEYPPRDGAGSPPGGQTLCPTHQKQADWQNGGVSSGTGKAYDGFWKCPVTGAGISFNGKLKSACPPPR